MRYKFKCDITAMDCFRLSMYRIYHSMVGVCSIIFAVSFLAMTIHFWGENVLVNAAMALGCLLVPVIQPAGTYLRARKQAAQLPKNMELWFGDAGIYVQADGKTANVDWKKISRAVKEPNMIIILESSGRGYMISDRVLGAEKEEFFTYLKARIS